MMQKMCLYYQSTLIWQYSKNQVNFLWVQDVFMHFSIYRIHFAQSTDPFLTYSILKRVLNVFMEVGTCFQ